MSVTTTANPATQTVLQALADYDLTHTGNDQTSDGTIEAPNPRSRSDEIQQNPDWWLEDYNGVPPYRPINYELDHESRPWARPGIETAFVWTMLNGVGIVAYMSRVWRSTGGKFNDRIFRFSIGGER